MVTVTEFVRALRGDESGQDLVEYVLIVILIAIAAIAVMASFGQEVNSTYQGAAEELQKAVNP